MNTVGHTVGCEYKISLAGSLWCTNIHRTSSSPASMSPSLEITFYGQHSINFKRTDTMRPMDLGDGPEVLQLYIPPPKDSSEAVSNPFFGTRLTYTGYLSGGGSTHQPVFVKWAKSRGRIQELEGEGGFYCSELRKLQGVVVPKFYGCYTATDHGLHEYGCMVLEKMEEGGDEIDK
jgi:hypothetical protein